MDDETYLAILAEGELQDKKNALVFLNLALKSTDAQVRDLELVDADNVLIHYESGTTRRINIHMDSPIAMLRDVLDRI